MKIALSLKVSVETTMALFQTISLKADYQVQLIHLNRSSFLSIFCQCFRHVHCSSYRALCIGLYTCTNVKQVAQLSQRNRAAGWISLGRVVGDGVGHGSILCSKPCRCQTRRPATQDFTLGLGFRVTLGLRVRLRVRVRITVTASIHTASRVAVWLVS